MLSSIHSLDSLTTAFRKGERLKFLFFWGHTGSHGRGVGKECLSQWYPAPFEVDGVLYGTAEHYMMHRKALLFSDDATAAKIVAARTPGEAKALGRAVRNFDETTWEQHRESMAIVGNTAKFTQSPALGAFLRGTRNRVLAEASPVDRIWGIGLAADNEQVTNPLVWRGLNLLGFSLMEVRRRMAP